MAPTGCLACQICDWSGLLQSTMFLLKISLELLHIAVSLYSRKWNFRNSILFLIRYVTHSYLWNLGQNRILYEN